MTELLFCDFLFFQDSEHFSNLKDVIYKGFAAPQRDNNLWDWTKSHGIEDYIYTMHPSSPHWNKPMPAKYGKANGLTSCEFFCKWLKEKWVG